MLNGVESTIHDIQHAGLPQGSPLSPILFLFYNADLVAFKSNSRGGSIAFIDDLTVWVVGPNAAANVKRLQEEILPQIERWSHQSGATFEPDKTELVHFTRNKRQVEETPSMQFMGHTIDSTDTVKILGVVLDSQLRFKQHAARASKRGEKAALALKRMVGLRPSAARQLFMATVAPVMDYAAPVWWPTMPNSTAHQLQRATFIGATACTGMFKSACREVAIAEASLQSSEERLKEHTRRYWIKLHTMPSHFLSWFATMKSLGHMTCDDHGLCVKGFLQRLCRVFSFPFTLASMYVKDSIEAFILVEFLTLG